MAAISAPLSLSGRAITRNKNKKVWCRPKYSFFFLTVFEVHLRRKIHLGGDGLEDETLLPSVWCWELNLSVKATGAQKGRVECIGTVRGHDHLDVDCLVKAVHLVQEFKQDTLNFTVGARLVPPPQKFIFFKKKA